MNVRGAEDQMQIDEDEDEDKQESMQCDDQEGYMVVSSHYYKPAMLQPLTSTSVPQDDSASLERSKSSNSYNMYSYTPGPYSINGLPNKYDEVDTSFLLKMQPGALASPEPKPAMPGSVPMSKNKSALVGKISMRGLRVGPMPDGDKDAALASELKMGQVAIAKELQINGDELQLYQPDRIGAPKFAQSKVLKGKKRANGGGNPGGAGAQNLRESQTKSTKSKKSHHLRHSYHLQSRQLAASTSPAPIGALSPQPGPINQILQPKQFRVGDIINEVVEKKRTKLLYQEPVIPFQAIKKEKKTELRKRQWDQAGANVQKPSILPEIYLKNTLSTGQLQEGQEIAFAIDGTTDSAENLSLERQLLRAQHHDRLPLELRQLTVQSVNNQSKNELPQLTGGRSLTRHDPELHDSFEQQKINKIIQQYPIDDLDGGLHKQNYSMEDLQHDRKQVRIVQRYVKDHGHLLEPPALSNQLIKVTSRIHTPNISSGHYSESEQWDPAAVLLPERYQSLLHQNSNAQMGKILAGAPAGGPASVPTGAPANLPASVPSSIVRSPTTDDALYKLGVQPLHATVIRPALGIQIAEPIRHLSGTATVENTARHLDFREQNPNQPAPLSLGASILEMQGLKKHAYGQEGILGLASSSDIKIGEDEMTPELTIKIKQQLSQSRNDDIANCVRKSFSQVDQINKTLQHAANDGKTRNQQKVVGINMLQRKLNQTLDGASPLAAQAVSMSPTQMVINNQQQRAQPKPQQARQQLKKDFSSKRLQPTHLRNNSSRQTVPDSQLLLVRQVPHASARRRLLSPKVQPARVDIRMQRGDEEGDDGDQFAAELTNEPKVVQTDQQITHIDEDGLPEERGEESRKSQFTNLNGDNSSKGPSTRQSPQDQFAKSVRRIGPGFDIGQRDEILIGSDEPIELYSKQKVIQKTKNSFVPILTHFRQKPNNLDQRPGKIEDTASRTIQEKKQTLPMDEPPSRNTKYEVIRTNVFINDLQPDKSNQSIDQILKNDYFIPHFGNGLTSNIGDETPVLSVNGRGHAGLTPFVRGQDARFAETAHNNINNPVLYLDKYPREFEADNVGGGLQLLREEQRSVEESESHTTRAKLAGVQSVEQLDHHALNNSQAQRHAQSKQSLQPNKYTQLKNGVIKHKLPVGYVNSKMAKGPSNGDTVPDTSQFFDAEAQASLRRMVGITTSSQITSSLGSLENHLKEQQQRQQQLNDFVLDEEVPLKNEPASRQLNSKDNTSTSSLHPIQLQYAPNSLVQQKRQESQSRNLHAKGLQTRKPSQSLLITGQLTPEQRSPLSMDGQSLSLLVGKEQLMRNESLDRLKQDYKHIQEQYIKKFNAKHSMQFQLRLNNSMVKNDRDRIRQKMKMGNSRSPTDRNSQGSALSGGQQKLLLQQQAAQLDQQKQVVLSGYKIQQTEKFLKNKQQASQMTRNEQQSIMLPQIHGKQGGDDAAISSFAEFSFQQQMRAVSNVASKESLLSQQQSLQQTRSNHQTYQRKAPPAAAKIYGNPMKITQAPKSQKKEDTISKLKASRLVENQSGLKAGTHALNSPARMKQMMKLDINPLCLVTPQQFKKTQQDRQQILNSNSPVPQRHLNKGLGFGSARVATVDQNGSATKMMSLQQYLRAREAQNPSQEQRPVIHKLMNLNYQPYHIINHDLEDLK